MKVAHLLRKYDPREWGGTETAVYQLLEGLRRHQVDAVVFSPRLDAAVPSDPYAVLGVEMKTYRTFIPIFGLSEQRKRQLTAVGGNIMSLDLVPALRREPGLSLIHLHTLGRIAGIGRTVARRRRIPYVVTLHGGYLDLPEEARRNLESLQQGGWEWGRVFGWLFGARKVVADADAVLTLNPNEAAKLAKRFPRKRIVVMPHGIPMAAFAADCRAAAREAFPAIVNRPVLLIVGRLDPVKNQAWVLDRLRDIRRRHPAVLLVMAGAVTDEAYGERLRQLIRDLGLQEDVLMTGNLPPRDPRLVGLMQSAAALVVPSISETFGLVILEGWSAGAPVIASRTSGATQIMRHRENGLLFDLGDPAGFHEALDFVMSRPAEAHSMTACGRALVEREFDNVAVTARVKSLYEELIREKVPCRGC